MRMKATTKLTKIFLALALALSMVPMQAQAAQTTETGTESTQGTSFPVYTLKKNVDDDQAMVLLIMGDGYTASEQEEFLGYAKQRAEALLRIEPFRKYANNINIYAMCVESAQSGVTTKYTDVESYLGVDANGWNFKWSTPVGGGDDSYSARAERLKKEVEDKVLTTSSDYKPKVSAAHIIVNNGNTEESSIIRPRNINGFTFSEESTTTGGTS
jgi:hypothetical protein